MVNEGKANQFEGFDFNDYAFIDSSANPLGANNIGIYVVGTNANAQVAPAVPIPPLGNIPFLMSQVPAPTPGGPLTSIGPQYPWPYEGSVPAPAAVPGLGALGLTNILNVAPAQKTLIRVVTNDIYVYFIDRRLANYLYNAWTIVAAIQALSGTFAAPIWPVPTPVLLQADIGQYEFERKWIWLLYVRAAAGADADLHVYMEG